VRLLGLSSLVALLAAGAALALAARTPAPSSPASAGVTENQHAAKRDAGLLLGRLVLPTEAKSLEDEPRGGGSALAAPQSVIASSDVVERHAWVVVPEPVGKVLAFVQAHPPSGSRLESSGSGGRNGRMTSWSLRFSWPRVPSVLDARVLSVVFVALSKHSTGVLAEAAAMWVLPRPAGERIPSQAAVLEVAVTRPKKRPSPPIVVTDRATIAKVATLIDALGTVQPAAISCPEIPAEGSFVIFTFSATQSGPVLAQASESARANGIIPECEPMRLTILGHPQTSLLGGASVVRKTEALLGISLRGARRHAGAAEA
jgi:hypothetical protein